MVEGWSDAELVRHRALFGPTGTGPGDWHLHQTHPLHGRVMSAGVARAEDVCTRDQIMAAAGAFDYLGLTDPGCLHYPRRSRRSST